MKKLDEATAKFISSSYAISSLEILIKELVENSIDAGSTRIRINLKRFGLDKIDVIDDGCGFNDASFICQRHCTSKISKFSDIENVKTFGFRGEVLSSICAISNLSITSNSNTDSNPIGTSWIFDKMGNIVAQSAITCRHGTTVSVSNVFHNLPVRCQMYKSLFVLQKSLKLIVRNLQKLYLSRMNIQLNLVNDNSVIVNLPQSSSMRDSIATVLGSSKIKYFQQVISSRTSKDDSEISLDAFIPTCVDDKLGLSHHDYRENCHLFINGRPVEVSDLFKAIRNAYNRFTKDSRSRYPTAFLYLTLPSAWVDVNVDPEKSKVKLSHIHDIKEFVEKELGVFYESLLSNSVLSQDKSISCDAIRQEIAAAPDISDNSGKSDSASTNVTSCTTKQPTNYIRIIKGSRLDDPPENSSQNDSIFSDSDTSFSSQTIASEPTDIHHTISGQVTNFQERNDQAVQEFIRERMSDTQLDQEYASRSSHKIPIELEHIQGRVPNVVLDHEDAYGVVPNIPVDQEHAYKSVPSTPINQEHVHGRVANIQLDQKYSHERVTDTQLDQEYARGRLAAVTNHPVRNVNLKRNISTDIDSEISTYKRKANADINEQISLNSNYKKPIDSSPKVHLSLVSLANENQSNAKLIPATDMSIVSCWDSFVVSIEMHKSSNSEFKEAKNLVIFRKKDIIFASIYLDNLANIQIPAVKLPCVITINENHKDLVSSLEKLPVQLIRNKDTQQEFFIVSCPQLIKNGYRLHNVKNGDITYFEVASKPSFIDEIQIFDEIRIILQRPVNSLIIERSEATRKWIHSLSKVTTETKFKNEILKLSGKGIYQYFKICVSKINKFKSCDVLQNLLPEMFRFSLNI